MDTSRHNLPVDECSRVLQYSHDGIMLADATGTVLMVNNAYLRLTGLPSNMVGRNMQEFIDEGYMKKSAALIAIKQKQVITRTHVNAPFGTLIVVSNPIFNDEGEVIQVVTNVRDMTEIYQLRNELEKAKEMEEHYYKQLLNENCDKQSPIAVSVEMKEVFAKAKKVSPVDVTVLILGESGVGKEVLAKYIHNHSNRNEGPFITINCGAIPEQLLESELFGYVGGAFTGAMKNGKRGLFEAANKGTLFLDEIGELQLNLQVKILRALENREIIKIGDDKPIPIDVRVLAATNRNLHEMVERKKFREDLYYRLNVVQLEIPPLRKRKEDIAPLSFYYLNYFNRLYNQEKRLSRIVIQEMERYAWPGNIRELKNAIENMVVVSSGQYFEIIDLPFLKGKQEEKSIINISEVLPLVDAVEEVEKQILKLAMHEYQSTRKIAKAVKVDQSTVVRKMKKYGLTNSEIY